MKEFKIVDNAGDTLIIGDTAGMKDVITFCINEERVMFATFDQARTIANHLLSIVGESEGGGTSQCPLSQEKRIELLATLCRPQIESTEKICNDTFREYNIEPVGDTVARAQLLLDEILRSEAESAQAAEKAELEAWLDKA